MANQQMDLDAMRDEFTEKANEVVGKAVEFARDKPHAAVAIAFGVGWVLGNGLPPRLILGAARLGWKAALGGLLAGGGLAALGGEQQEDEGEERGRSAVRGNGPRVGRAQQPSGAGGRNAPPRTT